MLVIDASALVDWLLSRPDTGSAIATEMLRARTVHTLDFADIEVVSALRRKTANREMSESRAIEALATLASAPFRRHRVAPLTRRAWELRHTISPYDAGYIALAEALRMPLLTADARLSTSHGHGAEIRTPG